MKKLLFILTLLFIVSNTNAQVGINTTLPNAQLDIRSSNQATPTNTDGIIIPKIDAFPITNPTAAQQGMMVYLTTLSAGKQPGFYYWDNTGVPQWIGFVGNSGWSLTGNTGTNPATNFIGTTDANDVVFKRDNVISGKIGQANTSFGRNSLNPLSSGIYNSTFGLNSLINNTTGNSNSAFGNYALTNNTTGNSNTGFGSNVMYTNTSGKYNTALGSNALEYNLTGDNNSATGYYSLYNNTIGNNNTAQGYESLYSNQTGGFNTAIGSRTLRASVTGSLNTAIGDDALSKSNGADLNVAVGGLAMLENISGSWNTAVGSNALRNNVSSSRNTAIGYDALYANTGAGNTAIGYQSNLAGTLGNRNITIGANTNVNDPAGNDQLSIANVIYGSDLNSTATGKIGIGVSLPTEKLEVDGKTKTTNLQVTAGATTGNVLTSDAAGNATWQAPSSSNAWNIAGNSNINPNINFIGTTNSIEVYFKFNNEKSGVIGASDTAFGHKSLGAYSLSNENSAFGVLAMGSIGLSGNQNTAIGNKSMQNINSGSKNVAVGFESLNGSLVPANNIGESNTAIGFQTLHKNSSGDFNVANGFVALFKNTTGNLNTANGSASMYNNTSGYENTANGAGSLYTNATGFQNVALGLDAMYFNTTGSKNNASGYRSLYNNTIGADNVVNGFEAMRANTSASKNVAIGNQALFKQNFTNSGAVYDSENVAIGFGSLYNTNGTTNINGKANIGIGIYALANNGIGNSNIAIGNSALGGAQTVGGSMTGNSNIAIGSAAIKSLSSGINNIALGSANLGFNTIGNENVSIGKDALFYSQEQSGGTVFGTRAMQNYGLTASIGTNNNVAIGFESMRGTSAGSIYTQNTAVGYQTLTINTAGNNNTANGYQSLFSNTSGSSNTAFGNEALKTNISGSNNIAIGNQAGFSETGSNKLYIENSNSTTPLIYGDFATDLLRFHGNVEIDNITTSDNKMQLVNKNNYTHGIGNQILGSGGDDFLLSSKEGTTESAGIYGDGNAVSIWSAGDANGGQSAALVYFMDEDAFDASNTNPYDASSVFPNPVALKSYISPAGAYFQVSDKNKKENIAKIENSLEKINQISGYTYQFKLASEEIKKGDKPIKSAGVLAQEVEKIIPEAIQKNAAGDYFVDYAAITPLLIEAIKAQNEKIKALENSQIEILKRLEKLENK